MTFARVVSKKLHTIKPLKNRIYFSDSSIKTSFNCDSIASNSSQNSSSSSLLSSNTNFPFFL